MVAVVGAGFSGCTVAWMLAESGVNVQVFDSRDHIGGNCHTKRDHKTGILEHVYGPHIFHTDDKEVWDFVSQFGEFGPYVNRVKATANGAVYSLPINLHTINQFFQSVFGPQEAQEFIQSIADQSIDIPGNFEEQARKMVGEDLYNNFLKGYTEKQWGLCPSKLPASILKRLPLRFNYDDNYFNHKYQGIPIKGYTELMEKMLSHRNIDLTLGYKFKNSETKNYTHVFYTGCLDSYFEYPFGRLPYRTLDFEKEYSSSGDYQGCAVMNYPDPDVPFTRITEHKHFAPWEVHDKTFVVREYSRECGVNDIPYYPVRLAEGSQLLAKYQELADEELGVTFLGRLGTYRYLDMDVTIREALDSAKKFLENRK